MFFFVSVVLGTFAVVLAVSLFASNWTRRQQQQRDANRAAEAEKAFPEELRRKLRLAFLRQQLEQYTMMQKLEQDQILEQVTSRKLSTCSRSTARTVSSGVEDDDTNSRSDEDSESAFDELEEGRGRIQVPKAGISCADAGDNDVRAVPSCCAVCLSGFEVDDQVVWSSNQDCAHVFHQECLVDWFQTRGEKEFKYDPKMDKSKQISNFEKACPCCRQTFIVDGNNVAIQEA